MRHGWRFAGSFRESRRHLAYRKAGVVSFYGPSLLAGFAENGGIHPYSVDALRSAMFQTEPYELHAAPQWTEEKLEWSDPDLANRTRRYWPNPGWAWLQGVDTIEGGLIGGCIETMEMAKGTPLWPADEEWDGAIFLLELSEEAPAPETIAHWLRNYEASGILNRIGALLLGRPDNYSQQRTFTLWDTVQRSLAEAGLRDLPLVANVDWGHCSPMGILPLGCRAIIDPRQQRITIPGSSVT